MVEIRGEQEHQSRLRPQRPHLGLGGAVEMLGRPPELDPAGGALAGLVDHFRQAHVVDAAQPGGRMDVRHLIPLPVQYDAPGGETEAPRPAIDERMPGCRRQRSHI